MTVESRPSQGFGLGFVGECRDSALGDHAIEAYASSMNAKLRKLPLEERIRLVEDLWDSIAADQGALPLTPEQRAELDNRLDAYEADRQPGRPAEDAIADIRKRL
jgi:putative addiction module component (TIGR02574 family)